MTTSSRRNFLSIAAAGSALATSGVFSAGASAAPADVAQGGGGGGHYVPPVKFGLGGVSEHSERAREPLKRGGLAQHPLRALRHLRDRTRRVVVTNFESF